MSQLLLRVICNLFLRDGLCKKQGDREETMLGSHVKSCSLQSRVIATRKLGGPCTLVVCI